MFVSCKWFSEKYLFSGNVIVGKWNYFQVFVNISKNVLKNIFWCLVVFLKIPKKTHFLLITHIFSAAKQIYNIIPQYRKTKKQNLEKKFIKSSQYINTKETKPRKKNSSNPVKLREGRERGNWVWARGEIAQRMRRRDRVAEVRSSGFGVDLCLISAMLRSTRPVECGSSDWSSVCGRWTRARFEG